MANEHRISTAEKRQSGAAAAAYEKKHISRVIREKQKEFGKLDDHDRTTISRNMWKMLARLREEHGIKRSSVCRHVFGDCNGANPTKYMSKYATAPGRDPSERLARKFNTYFAFVEKVEAAWPNVGDLMIEVFADAQFWRKYQRSADSRHVELAQRLCNVMKGVADKNNLQEYFRNVRNLGGVFTPNATTEEWQAQRDGSWFEHQVGMEFVLFNDERQNWPIELERPSQEAEDGDGDSIAAYPVVDLGWWQLGDAFSIAIAANIPTEDGSSAEISGAVSGRTLASLQLCIIPTGSELEPTPALRVALTTRLDALTEVAVHGEAQNTKDPALRELLSFPWHNIPALSRGTTLIPARLPAGSVDCECRATVDADVLPESFRGDFSMPNVEVQRLNWARALRFFPLTGNVCVEWFGLRMRDSLGTSMRTRLADWVNSMPLTNRGVVDRGGEFEPGSLAKAIDDFLHAEDGLVGELEMSARKRIDLVEQTRVQSRQAREAGWQKVMQRLGKSVEERLADGNDPPIDNNRP